MKKILICFLALVTLVLATSCKNEELNNNIDDIENNKPENNQSVNYDKASEDSTEKDVSNLSLEDLKAMDETAESDFEYEKVDGGISITGYLGKDAIVVLPDRIDNENVVEIGDYAFANNNILQAIRISDSIKIIEEHAFENCTELKALLCGSSLETIDSFAFSSCPALNTVELNEGLLNLNRSCFGMPTFREIFVPSSVIYMDVPFLALNGDKITVISEAGSYVESQITEWGERYGLEFKAK